MKISASDGGLLKGSLRIEGWGDTLYGEVSNDVCRDDFKLCLAA